jgi:predicted O-methyltransferase YrrM
MTAGPADAKTHYDRDVVVQLRSHGHRARELTQRLLATAREQGFGAVAYKALRYPLKPMFVAGAVRALQAERDRIDGSDELVDFVKGFNYRGIHIMSWQRKTEIVGLLRLLEQSRPQHVVEIGTASGGTLFMLTQVAAANAAIVSVDLPGGRLGGGASTVRHRYPRWRTRLYRGFARPGQTVHAIRANSHEASTVHEVQERLAHDKVDFLFVDGDHSYAGVSRDFELYLPLVRKGGLVAFHDIVPSGPGKHGDPGDVPRFWAEIRGREAVEAEYVEDWEWGSCGIGVIRI